MKKLIIGTILLGNLFTVGVMLFDGFNNEATAQQGCTDRNRARCWKKQ